MASHVCEFATILFILPLALTRPLNDGVDTVISGTEAQSNRAGLRTIAGLRAYHPAATARRYSPTKRLLMPVDLESSHHSVLVGRYFHSFKEMDGHKVVDGQGQVVEQINDKYFLVRLDWRVGTGSVQQVITLEEMLGWHFYENVEDMREWLKRAHKEDNAKIPLTENPPSSQA